MSYRDYAAWAAKQYGVDPGIIDGIAKFESGYRPGAVNNWDSNAQAGTPSKGIMQFIQPTFNGYAREAAKANPNAWKKFGGNFDWMNPQQQMLAASWAIANGKGSAWATYDKAKQYAANEYNYQPKWRMGGAQQNTAGPMYSPDQIAKVRSQFDTAIKQQRGLVTDATNRMGKFNITEDQQRLLASDVSPREMLQMGYGGRRQLANGPTQMQQQFLENKQLAESNLDLAKNRLTDLQKQRTEVVDKLANMQLPKSVASGVSDNVRSQLVATARQEVGTVAAQAMKYIRASGGTGYEAWCGDFVRYVFKQNGLTPPPARYVPDLLKWAQGNDTLRKTGRAGDLAMFDWNNDGVPDHVELVTGGRGAGRYQTIGGNTSGNRGSSQVAQKLRTGNILGFVDVLSALGVKA